MRVATREGRAETWPEPRAIAGDCARGFTLLEVMIVCAIVAILAAIALPNYRDYIIRGKIIEATSALSDLRVRYEQYFLDNRTYVGACGAGGIQAAVQAGTKSFVIACGNESTTTYTGTATGDPTGGMDAGTVYQIIQGNQKSTVNPPPGWGNLGCGWVVRRDGSCT